MRATVERLRAVFTRSGAFDPEHGVYIFHHMPKCGGTALRLVLAEWFTLVSDYINVAQLRGEEPVAPPLDLQALGKDTCVCGHFESRYNHLRLRYPEAFRDRKRHFLFSFVRDPLELAMSLYYHAVKVGRLDPRACTLLDFIDSQSNYMAQRFPCTSRNYREVLNRYNFVGLQEDMPLSVNKLAAMLGQEPVRVPLRNATPRDGQEAAVDAETIARFRSRNALDYAIYDHVKKRFLR